MINCQKINEVISGTLIAADTSLFSNVASPAWQVRLMLYFYLTIKLM